MKKISLFIIALFSISLLTAQTADVTIGCAPLEVNFDNPVLSTYFWDFGDGNNSNLDDPSHNYINPGVFTVELFEGVGGPKIGEIIITVLAVPEINIGANEREGCSPFQVSFTNESTIDPNSQVTGFFWDFGDGGNSTLENPTYTYANEGTFTVSLRIESDLKGCTTTETFKDYINVSGNVNAGFSIDNSVICDAPATFNITNNTIDMSGYTYSWDFGNGQTSTDYNPPAATYTEEGTFTITMIVDNGDGCVVTLSRIVKVGKPEILIDVPDTVCLGQSYLIPNSTQANIFSWSFGSNASPQTSNLRNPSVIFNQAGPQIVTFSAIASSECSADTFFTVFVEDPKAAFAIDPIITCTDPAVYTFTHPQNGLANYTWYIEELDTLLFGGPEYTFTYDEPTRDSFYISRQDTFTVFLSIETNAGCMALDSLEFYHRAPQAHFVPNVSRGCAPLTVNFDELSLSTEDIISWDWVFGDGTEANTNTPDDMSHTYTEPGEYYVQLAIENDLGCKDTSAGVWIYVGEIIDSDFTFDQTEICLHETVNFEALNLDPRIDAWHFDTDDGRISDCYETPDASHTFVHAPGTYPVSLTIEYNGCFNEINNGETITVNGSKPIIKFMTNCEDPYTVMFQDSSLNASTAIWYINGDTINMDTITEDFFNYTFDSTGDYQIKLWTDDDTMCPPDSATVDVYIRDIQANFEFPEKLCAFTPYQLDASMSVDVDETCSKGYEWFGIANRPRQIDYPVVDAAWAPGSITVRLVVEDLNGCKDEITKTSKAFAVDADFVADRNKICFPTTMSFMDQSVGDTTLVDWEWSFGSNQQNPTDVLFAEGAPPFFPVSVIVKDVLGCVDTAEVNILVYEPVSNVSFTPGNVVCLGDMIDFTATDFTQEGSFLNYNWSFGPMGTSIDQNPSITVTEPGITTISLIITEDSTGCTNEYNLNIQGIVPPTADFEIDVDNPDRICPDEIVEFINNSTLDGPGGYLWDFGNGSTAFIENPSTFFDVGTFDITLTVSSIYGCSDTHTEQILLEGPQGDFTIDKDVLCLGDTVTFNLFDTSDVTFFEWDFGDGTTLQNDLMPIHPYTFLPDTLAGSVGVSIILESSNGCTRTISKSIELNDLQPAFEIIEDTTSLCRREIQFINNTEGGVSYTWDFGNGETSTDTDPFVTYLEDGTYTISLFTESADGTCQSTITEDLEIIIANLEASFFSEIDTLNPCIKAYQFTNTTMGGDTYTWNFGDGETSTEENPYHTYSEGSQDTFTVTLTVEESGANCSSTATEIIPIELISKVQVPTVFSPNSDGTNDFFDIILKEEDRECVEVVKSKIFNRWGNLIYDNALPAEGWNGMYDNGDVAPAEIYTYILEVVYSSGETEFFKGTFTLIK